MEQLLNEQQFKDETTQNHYKSGISYQQKMQFHSKWPECEEFYEGEQWPQATPETRNLPRPVFNIIKYIISHKKASVSNEAIKMVFSSEEIQDETGINPDIENGMLGAEKFTKFADSTWERIQQDKLNDEMINNSAIIGTGILHYYWDNSKIGGIANKYIGDIEGEVLDPSNVFFGNPQVREVQKQPYIIITSRENLKDVKEKAKSGGVPEHLLARIQNDKNTTSEIYAAAKHEVDGSEKITVVTEYFKENGEIFFKKVVGDIVIVQATKTGLSKYPLVVMPWSYKKKCIYGIGEAEGLITNQKGVNFLLAMMLLSCQETAWPKVISKPGALKQKISNKPGEHIIDHYIGNGDGVKYMQTPNFNPQTMGLVDKFIDITKSFAGANDAAVGEAPGADMAAQAIMLLQRSAGMPLEDIKKAYYRAMEDVGRIWEDFYKHKFNMERAIKIKDNLGQEYMESMTGTDYQDIPMNLKIDIGASGVYSEYMAQATLDKLYDKQAIDTITYLKFSAPSSVPFRDKLIAELERQYQEKMQQMQMGMMMPGEEMLGGEMPPMDDMQQVATEPEVIAPGNTQMGIAGVKEPNI